MEKRLDRTLRITHQGKQLRYREISSRPVKVCEIPKRKRMPTKTKPKAGHPWHGFQFGHGERAQQPSPP